MTLVAETEATKSAVMRTDKRRMGGLYVSAFAWVTVESEVDDLEPE